MLGPALGLYIYQLRHTAKALLRLAWNQVFLVAIDIYSRAEKV